MIQTLDPPGIGARDLTECLLLQLAQTSHFSASTVHLIRYGLPLLAQRDYKGLSALLELPERDAKAAAEVIRSLNPIPSNGFASQTPQPYTVPEAVIHRDGGRLSVELYARRWRRLSCNQTYLSMIGSAAYHEAQDYLKQKKREAEELIAAVESRDQLIQQIIEYIVSTQRPHLLSGQPLQPMTMSDLAQALRVNVSTISRAIREKYILLDTKVVLLRSLFSARLETSSGMAVSAEYAKMQVKRIIAGGHRDRHDGGLYRRGQGRPTLRSGHFRGNAGNGRAAVAADRGILPQSDGYSLHAEAENPEIAHQAAAEATDGPCRCLMMLLR